MKQSRILLLVLLLVVTACMDSEQPCAALPGGGNYCLQPTSAVAPFDAQQKTAIHFRDRHETIIVEIENDADALRFVGLTPFGQKLVQVSYDNRKAVAGVLPDRRVSPTMLIALLQLVLWPEKAVRAGLEMPLTLEENALERRIVNNGQTTMTIRYSDAQRPSRRMVVTVHAFDLELDIETLSESKAQ